MDFFFFFFYARLLTQRIKKLRSECEEQNKRFREQSPDLSGRKPIIPIRLKTAYISPRIETFLRKIFPPLSLKASFWPEVALFMHSISQ